MSQVTTPPPAGRAEPALVVRVEDAISHALAGHKGVQYRSPPLPRAEALALVGVLLGDDRAAAGAPSWRCAIAGGQRTVNLEPAASVINTNGREAANGARPSTSSMHLIATTDERGLHVDSEQLERAGIKPGSRALVEIRPYTEEDWIAAGERTFAGGDEFLAYLGACPSHVEE